MNSPRLARRSPVVGTSSWNLRGERKRKRPAIEQVVSPTIPSLLRDVTVYDLGAGLSEFQPSAVRFHDPSACFFKMTNHLPLSFTGAFCPGTFAVNA